MSWVEKIQTEYKITTGDGASFTPLWLNANKSVEYNLASYEFPNISGTLVKRSLPKGRRYNIEIYFDGADNLDKAAAFETSAADPKPWTISHPLYGSILVQPIGLAFDDSAFNVTKVTGTVIETITEDAPKGTSLPKEKIESLKSITDGKLSAAFTVDVPAPRVADVTKMKKNILDVYNQGVKKLKSTADAEKLFNAYNEANSFVNNIISGVTDPLTAVGSVQKLLSLPADFADSLQNRLRLLADQFNHLVSGYATLFSRSEKKILEHSGGTIITTMALATVKNASFNSRNDALQAVDVLLAAYDNYLTVLDALQSPNGGLIGAYMPDAGAIQALSQLIGTAVSNLFAEANNSRQERTIYLEDDSNVVSVAYRLYGLKEDDSTIEQVINTNGIGVNEYLQLKKGRKIIYYV